MLSYVNSATEATSFNIYVTFAIAVVILVGIMGTIKGVMLLSASKSDTRKLGEAITHMIGGVAAINIQTIISMFGETVGGNVGTFISEQIIS
jgi:CheY-specific phosphatase CheX